MSQEYVRAVEQISREGEDEQLTALVEALPQLSVCGVASRLVVIGHLFCESAQLYLSAALLPAQPTHR